MLRERIGIEKFDDTIWTEIDDKLPVHITSKKYDINYVRYKKGLQIWSELFLEDAWVASILVESW